MKPPSTGALLLEFLYFFGDKFDYKTTGVSICHKGGMYFELDQSRRQHTMWIEDPICPGNNVMAATFKIDVVANWFSHGFLELVRHRTEMHYPLMISRLVQSSPWIEKFHYDASVRAQKWIEQFHLQQRNLTKEALRNALPRTNQYSNYLLINGKNKKNQGRHFKAKISGKSQKGSGNGRRFKGTGGRSKKNGARPKMNKKAKAKAASEQQRQRGVGNKEGSVKQRKSNKTAQWGAETGSPSCCFWIKNGRR